MRASRLACGCRHELERERWIELCPAHRSEFDELHERANRRQGELLKQVPEARGGDRRSDQWEGDHPLVTRTALAESAGISEHQRRHNPNSSAASQQPGGPTGTALAMPARRSTAPGACSTPGACESRCCGDMISPASTASCSSCARRRAASRSRRDWSTGRPRRQTDRSD